MKFKVGDKVIFTARPEYCSECKQDSGKIGKVVRTSLYVNTGLPTLFSIKIPNSHLGKDIPYTWVVRESSLSFAKNYQLLFSFMEDNNG